jgi:hypothetical protein
MAILDAAWSNVTADPTSGATCWRKLWQNLAQDGDECGQCRSQFLQHAAQLIPLPIRLRGHAAEDDLLAVIVADLSKSWFADGSSPPRERRRLAASPTIWQQRAHLCDDTVVFRGASVGHNLGDEIEGMPRVTAHRLGKNRGARTSTCQTTRPTAARGHP